MAKLSEDLEKYADEFFTRGDLEAGKKLLKELVGVVVLVGGIFTIATVWFPLLGLKVGTLTSYSTWYKLGCWYEHANEDQRKSLRAAVNWIKGGFSLGHRLIG